MKPHILWFTIESGRFDSTSLAEGEDGPLQDIVDENRTASFSRAHSHGIWTRSSSASILTGTYPSHHRVGENNTDILPKSIPTVPELLRDIGYNTVCLMNGAHVDDSSGLNRGFEKTIYFSQDDLLNNVPKSTLFKYMLNIRKHGGGITTNLTKHSTSFMMSDVAKKMINKAEKDDKPLFLYSHYNDPHHPYTPPKPMFKKVARRHGFSIDEAFDIVMDHNRNFLEHIAHGCDIPDNELSLLRELHEKSVRYVESQIKNVYDYITSIDRDTIVVITADHGELFGEDGILAHRLSTHSAISHVPLIVSGPTDVVDHDSERVQHIDVMTTILAEQEASTTTLQGVNLQEEYRDMSIIQRAGERARNTIETLQKINPDFDPGPFPLEDLTVFRTDEYKYEMSANHERLLVSPDGEDVSQENEIRVERFRETAKSFFESDGKPASNKKRMATLDAKARNRLERLGYVD